MRIELDPESLLPIIEASVEAAIRRMDAADAKLGDRLGFTESEAAQLIGVKPHVLRDLRLRGEIAVPQIGKRYIYSRELLAKLLTADV